MYPITQYPSGLSSSLCTVCRDAETRTRINLHRTAATLRVRSRIFVERNEHTRTGQRGETVRRVSRFSFFVFRFSFRGTWSGTWSALNKESGRLEVGVDLSRSNMQLEGPYGRVFLSKFTVPLIRPRIFSRLSKR